MPKCIISLNCTIFLVVTDLLFGIFVYICKQLQQQTKTLMVDFANDVELTRIQSRTENEGKQN